MTKLVFLRRLLNLSRCQLLRMLGCLYVLVWRNGCPKHNYAPFPGQESAEDLKEFYQQANTLFMEDVASKELYESPEAEK